MQSLAPNQENRPSLTRTRTRRLSGFFGLLAAAAALFCLASLTMAGTAFSYQVTVKADNPKLMRAIEKSVAELTPGLLRVTGAEQAEFTIVVPANKAAFNEMARKLGAPDWAAGLALPNRNTILLRSPGQLIEPARFNELLAHELTHIYLARVLGRRRAPLWLEEGVAMWASGESSLGRMWAMSRAALMDEFIPFGRLTRRFPADKTRASLAYAQSYYFVSYIVRNHGPEAVAKMLQGISQGKDLGGVVHAFSGLGLWGLEQEFIKSISSRFSWIMVFVSSGALWGVIALFAAVGLVVRRRAQLKMLWDMPDAHPKLGAFGPIRIWPPPKRRCDPLYEAGLSDKKTLRTP
jgi:hypothetical protein